MRCRSSSAEARSSRIGCSQESKTRDPMTSVITLLLTFFSNENSESRPEIRVGAPIAQSQGSPLNREQGILAIKRLVEFASESSRRFIANIPKGRNDRTGARQVKGTHQSEPFIARPDHSTSGLTSSAHERFCSYVH